MLFIYFCIYLAFVSFYRLEQVQVIFKYHCQSTAKAEHVELHTCIHLTSAHEQRGWFSNF